MEADMSSKKKSYYSGEMINEICEEIDRQWNYHGRVRASFPATAGHIAHWLNQNYIVRLCGILDEYQVITKGKQDGNDFTLVLAGLRHRVGAHTRGYWDPENSDDRKIAELIRKHFDSSVDDEAVRRVICRWIRC
jgi:hypothetical protein